MYTQRKVLVFLGLVFDFLSVNGQTVNLPNKVTVPENTETGVTIFTIESKEKISFELVYQYPKVTSEVLEYDAKGQVIKIKNGSLFDYEGEHRTYVMRFQETLTHLPTPDLILVIEVDVKEASDTGSLSSGSSGCCDDVSAIRWMVPAFTAVELFVLIVSCSILLICILKKSNRITVEN